MSDTTAGPELLQDKFDVVVRGKRYTFRVPSIRYDMEVGYKAAQLRRLADPEGIGDLNAVDFAAVTSARACAVMELYLIAADEDWPFTAGSDGKPKVDSSLFPLRKRRLVAEIGGTFQKTFETFCADGDTDGDTPKS